MKKIPPLNALKAFEVSGRHLNFRRAAEELGVTQGAVSQHIRSLEALLEIKLFERQARGLSLTNEGRRYLPAIRRAFEMISEATENLMPQARVVTISTTPSFATRWMVPRLGRLSADLPESLVRLDASNTLSNFQTDGVDLAVRLGTPPFGAGLKATLLFSQDVIAVCHPDLVSNGLLAPKDLQRTTLLEDAHGQWPLFLERAFGDNPVPEMKTMMFSQTSLAIDAAIAGQGVALTNKAFVETELNGQRLCEPFDFSIAVRQGHYLVQPHHSRTNPSVDAVKGWLLKQGENQ